MPSWGKKLQLGWIVWAEISYLSSNLSHPLTLARLRLDLDFFQEITHRYKYPPPKGYHYWFDLGLSSLFCKQWLFSKVHLILKSKHMPWISNIKSRIQICKIYWTLLLIWLRCVEAESRKARIKRAYKSNKGLLILKDNSFRGHWSLASRMSCLSIGLPPPLFYTFPKSFHFSCAYWSL